MSNSVSAAATVIWSARNVTVLSAGSIVLLKASCIPAFADTSRSASLRAARFRSREMLCRSTGVLVTSTRTGTGAAVDASRKRGPRSA